MRASPKLLLLALATTALPASAYEQGDLIVRAGPALVSPDVSTDTGTAGIDVDNNVQLGIAAAYLFHPNVGVEVLAATPFEHDISLNGVDIGSTRHLPPTVSLQWYPLRHERVQPYLGVGINHTVFFEEASTLGRLDLDASTGLALEAGVDVMLNDRWLVNASVWKIDLNTDVSLNGAPLGELELAPWAGMIGAGMKF